MKQSPATNQRYDLIVLGATGFTGKLVVEYLYNKYGTVSDLHWAVGGRSEERLQALIDGLGATELDTILVDTLDRTSVERMVQSTKVVCTTVGPYAKYGSLVVEICVQEGVDYCDLSGEVQWMRKMINKYHDAAASSGSRIVHSCGFDSIPSDMGVYYLQREAKKRRGAYTKHVKFRVKAMKGGFSGGTYASLSNVMKEAQEDKSVLLTLTDPYGLNPVGQRQGDDVEDLRSVVYDGVIERWVFPFIMAGINTKVVRRSHALSNYQYGRHFRYDEAMIAGSGWRGRLKGIAAASAMGLMMAGQPGSFYRRFLERFIPKPGEGPSAEERAAGFFDIRLIGIMPDDNLFICKVTGDRDPGYGSTSKMLGESAVCLALDQNDTNPQGGVLTPSIVMGDALIQRLTSNAGLTFDVIEDSL